MLQREHSVRAALSAAVHAEHIMPHRGARAIAGAAVVAAVLGVATVLGGPGGGINGIATAALNPLESLTGQVSGTTSLNHPEEECGPIAEDLGVTDVAGVTSNDAGQQGVQLVQTQVLPPIIPGGLPIDIPDVFPDDDDDDDDPTDDDPTDDDPTDDDPTDDDPTDDGGENLIDISVGALGLSLLDLELLPGDLVDADVGLLQDDNLIDANAAVGEGPDDIVEVGIVPSGEELPVVNAGVLQDGDTELIDVGIDPNEAGLGDVVDVEVAGADLLDDGVLGGDVLGSDVLDGVQGLLGNDGLLDTELLGDGGDILDGLLDIGGQDDEGDGPLGGLLGD